MSGASPLPSSSSSSTSFTNSNSNSNSNSDGAGRSVLVTGASGYIASHIVQQLLQFNYRVRGTVRSTKDTKLIQHLQSMTYAVDRLELVEADLLNDESWIKAVKGCEFIIHVASPCILDYQVKDVEKDLIQPAVRGTLSVLKAAAATKGHVKRVVLTSSVAAIMEGHLNDPKYAVNSTYTEEDFSDLNGDMDGYCTSKVKAEQAAREFLKGLSEEEKFEFCTIHPAVVMGPLLASRDTGCAETIIRTLTRREPKPRISFPIVDVRDVALVHIRALTAPSIHFRRFICAHSNGSLVDMAAELAKEFNPLGYSVMTAVLPNWVISVAAWFNKEAASAKRMLGREARADGSRTEETLGIKFRDWRLSIVEMAYSLIELKMVEDKRPAAARIQKNGEEESKSGDQKKAESD